MGDILIIWSALIHCSQVEQDAVMAPPR